MPNDLEMSSRRLTRSNSIDSYEDGPRSGSASVRQHTNLDQSRDAKDDILACCSGCLFGAVVFGVVFGVGYGLAALLTYALCGNEAGETVPGRVASFCCFSEENNFLKNNTEYDSRYLFMNVQAYYKGCKKGVDACNAKSSTKNNSTEIVPSTMVPSTMVPSTVPSTMAPSTVLSTMVPSTMVPSTVPSTMVPSTMVLSTVPSTMAPSTMAPSTMAPSTMAPSTMAPSTMAPSTVLSTIPSTMAPSTAPKNSTKEQEKRGYDAVNCTVVKAGACTIPTEKEIACIAKSVKNKGDGTSLWQHAPTPSSCISGRLLYSGNILIAASVLAGIGSWCLGCGTGAGAQS